MKRHHHRTLLYVLSLLLWSGPVYAQFACPFADSAAVADTLNPTGYYPLQVGNTWEYVGRTPDFVINPTREEVVADTLINEEVFYTLKVSVFNQGPGNPLAGTLTTHFEYLKVDSSGVVSWSNDQGLDTLNHRFTGPFNSCYARQSDASTVAIIATEPPVWEVEEEGAAMAYELSAIKGFWVGFAGEIYGHGIGRLQTVDDIDFREDLTYARIDGRAFGTRQDSLFTVGVAAEEGRPSAPRIDFALHNYPNPFTTRTTIQYSLAEGGGVALRVYNVLGQTVETLVERVQAAGAHQISFDASALPSGVYFYTLTVGDQAVTRSMMVAR